MSEPRLPAFARYPKHPLHRALFRLPILAYRLGLGFLVGRLVMIMSTTGRKSGQVRRTAIEYHRCNGRIYVMSGYGARPDWYQNMLADPRMTLQSAAGVQHVRGRRVTAIAELNVAYDCLEHSPALRFVTRLLGVAPTREAFLAGQDQFYLVTFEPTDEPTPPPLAADLRGVWFVTLAGLLVGWMALRRRREVRPCDAHRSCPTP